MKVEVIREELHGYNGRAVLVKSEDERYFVISTINSAFDTGLPETLVFESDENGNTSFNDVAGGTGVSRDDALAELESVLDGGPRSPRPGFFGALLDAVEDSDPFSDVDDADYGEDPKPLGGDEEDANGS